MVPHNWCMAPEERMARGVATPLLLFIGSQPVFDGCMEHICLADRPDQYNVSWLQTFNLDKALTQRNLSLRESMMKYKDMTSVSEQISYALVDYASNLQSSLQQLDEMIANSGDGWLLGSGDWYDPCVDRQGIINTIIVFMVFFLVCAIVPFDYFLQRRTQGRGVAGAHVVAYEQVPCFKPKHVTTICAWPCAHTCMQWQNHICKGSASGKFGMW